MSDPQSSLKSSATDPATQSTRVGDGGLTPTLPFSASSPDKQLGQIGKYRIGNLIGAGGMGAVYLAEDSILNRKVAVKVLLPDARNPELARTRFLREARAVAALSHDHI